MRRYKHSLVKRLVTAEAFPITLRVNMRSVSLLCWKTERERSRRKSPGIQACLSLTGI